MIAAAAMLGENQQQEEEPRRLSSGGAALANAARDLELVGEALAERDWQAATAPLAAFAASLRSAAAVMDGIMDCEGLCEAAAEC